MPRPEGEIMPRGRAMPGMMTMMIMMMMTDDNNNDDDEPYLA